MVLLKTISGLVLVEEMRFVGKSVGNLVERWELGGFFAGGIGVWETLWESGFIYKEGRECRRRGEYLGEV